MELELAKCPQCKKEFLAVNLMLSKWGICDKCCRDNHAKAIGKRV